jgi:hypothetical protein
MMKNKSQLTLTMLFIAFGGGMASAIAESIHDEQLLPAAGVADFAPADYQSAEESLSPLLKTTLAIHAEYGQLMMSDNSTRREISVRGTETPIQEPIYKGTSGIEFAAAGNRLENTAYFNPKNRHTAQISYSSDWLTYRRYSHSFASRLILALGRYAEHGFASGNIGSVGYEARADLNGAMALSFGVGIVRRIYSGVVSSGPEARIGFNWKFL